MSLWWQDAGERSHVVDIDHWPRPFETFRAICGRWCEVWPEDVSSRPPRWLRIVGMPDMNVTAQVPCQQCDRIWAEMDELDTARRAQTA